jgi:anthranilate synthase component 1
MSLKLKPTLEEIQDIISSGQGNTIPIYAELEADFLTPVSAYLKVADRCDYSFLFESVEGGENISRYSFIGSGKFVVSCNKEKHAQDPCLHVDPYKLIKVGGKEKVQGDPLIPIQKELEKIKYVKIPGLPSFTGKKTRYN